MRRSLLKEQRGPSFPALAITMVYVVFMLCLVLREYSICSDRGGKLVRAWWGWVECVEAKRP